MSQTEQHCACDPSNLVMLPVRGFGLAVDPSGLVPAPAPVLTCRERVDRDMHIYINGNLETSGDGLSPETAVKGYADAVLALSKYDGCNQHAAHLHFLSLEDTEATYPDFTVFSNTYSTFTSLRISGESYETTHLGVCSFQMGTVIAVSEVSMRSLASLGSHTSISGDVAFKANGESYAMNVNYGGCLYILENVNVYFHAGSCTAYMKITSSMMLLWENSKFHTIGSISASVAFLYVQYNGSITIGNTVDFSGCTSVLGRKYYLMGLSYINSNGTTLPGTQAPMLETGSIYV